jgi:hypothetical protein
MEYKVIFNSSFFKMLSNKWLNSKDIYLLLESIYELEKNKDIKISKEPLLNENSFQPENGIYFVTNYSNLNYFLSKSLPYKKTSYYDMKINGKNKIKCCYSSSDNYHRRIYYLLKNPKYAFIHYRYIKKEIKPNIIPSIHINLETPIKIKDFNPENIVEGNDKGRLFIVIETLLTYNDLLIMNSILSVGFGNKFVSCHPLSNNLLSCDIPPQNEKEIIIDIYLRTKTETLKKISFYDKNNKKCFKYIKNNINLLNKENNIYQIKENYKIFSFSQQEIIHYIIEILDYLITHINFLEDKKEENLNLAFLRQNNYINFNEENMNKLLEEISLKLNKYNKMYLIDYLDNEGYNILHYICALNYESSLTLLNSYKFDVNNKSKDNLTAYEICAGKRNLNCLIKLIDIIDDLDEKEEKNLYDFDVLKSALNISLDKRTIDLNDIQILDTLIKQIKIKYTVDSTSGKIINSLQKKEYDLEEDNDSIYQRKKENIRFLQRFVRNWLRRNKYKSLKKAADKLIRKFKNYHGRLTFLKKRESTIYIQKLVRKWLGRKHTKKTPKFTTKIQINNSNNNNNSNNININYDINTHNLISKNNISIDDLNDNISYDSKSTNNVFKMNLDVLD